MPALASGLRLGPKAKPAQFDASAQQRRVLIAKIKVALKELGIADDDYREMLLRVTGHLSAAVCNVGLLVRMVEELKAKGFAAKPREHAPRGADHPGARKARALWISLHHLGAVRDSSEHALEKFGRRQLGCEKLQWANQAQMYKLIEALKSMAERNGWSQDQTGIAPSATVAVLKRRLCQAILNRLVTADIVPARWSIGEAAFRLAGIKPEGASELFWSHGDLDLVAAALGRKLREASDAEMLS